MKVDVKKLNKQHFYIIIKRFFDLIACTVGIVLLSPLFLIIAICIKIDDPKGPVFYSQVRVGKNEQHFKMFKFRSMVTNADQLLQDLKDRNEISGAMFKLKSDPRVTRIGRIIRKYSLDELPQLLNVINAALPAILSPQQKEKKTSNLLQKMKKDGIIDTDGGRRFAKWFLVSSKTKS